MSYVISPSEHDAAFSYLTTTASDSIKILFCGILMFLLTLWRTNDASMGFSLVSLGVAHVVVLPSTRSELNVPFGAVELAVR